MLLTNDTRDGYKLALVYQKVAKGLSGSELSSFHRKTIAKLNNLRTEILENDGLPDGHILKTAQLDRILAAEQLVKDANI